MDHDGERSSFSGGDSGYSDHWKVLPRILTLFVLLRRRSCLGGDFAPLFPLEVSGFAVHSLADLSEQQTALICLHFALPSKPVNCRLRVADSFVSHHCGEACEQEGVLSHA